MNKRIAFTSELLSTTIAFCLLVSRVSADQRDPLPSIPPEADTPSKIIPYLQDRTVAVRLEAIKRLKAIGSPESTSSLIDHCRKLPSGQPSSHASQPEKTKIIEAVGALQPAECKEFLREQLTKEIDASREAERYDQGTYFPYDATAAILRILKDNHATDPKLGENLKSSSVDKTIPSIMREMLVAASLEFEMRKNGTNTIQEKVHSAATKLRPLPVLPVPWDIQRDQQKRIEFGATPERKEALRRYGEIWRSEQGIFELGLERYLRDLGRPAADVLVTLTLRSEYGRDEGATMMLIASQILADHLRNSQIVTDSDRNLIVTIRKYCDEMPDLGASDRKGLLQGSLNSVDRNLERLSSSSNSPKQ